MSTASALRPLTVRFEEDQLITIERLARASKRTVAQEVRYLLDVALGAQDRDREDGDR